MHDALCLDMEGTLVRFSYVFHRDGHPDLPVDDLQAAWLERHGRMTLVELLADLGAGEPARLAEEIVMRQAQGIEPFPDTLATLAELRRRGYRLALVSNVSTPGGEYAEALDRIGVGPLLDAMVFSHDVGARKPDPRIFAEALERLRTSPERAAHVGDLLKSDVKGAKAAGMYAVHVDRGPNPEETGGPEPDLTVRSLAELLEHFP